MKKTILISVALLIALFTYRWWSLNQTNVTLSQKTVQTAEQDSGLFAENTQSPSNTNSDTSLIKDTLILTQNAALEGAMPSGVSSVSILVGKGEVTPPQKRIGPDSMPNYALGESSGAGGITIKNGRWYAGIVAPSGVVILEPGIYTVALYNEEDGSLLASTKLTVKAQFIIIDKASLVSSSAIPTITGSAAPSVHTVSVTIQSYNAAKEGDWVNLSSKDVEVKNGKWSYTEPNSYTSSGTYAPGQLYRVLVSLRDAEGHILPETTLTVSLTIK